MFHIGTCPPESVEVCKVNPGERFFCWNLGDLGAHQWAGWWVFQLMTTYPCPHLTIGLFHLSPVSDFLSLGYILWGSKLRASKEIMNLGGCP